MIVIVAEKPSVAKGIAQVVGATNRYQGYLEGNGYQVTWCVGHLIGLYNAQDYDPSLEEWDVRDLPILPKPFKTKVAKSTEDQFNVVKGLINSASEVIEATDAGREGELIFRLVYEQARCKVPAKRLWISSLEVSAIKKGMQNLKPISDYDDLAAAAKARLEADWLVGINCTRWYSCSYHITLTTGRVQTPTLNMVVMRELAIKNFKATPYWMLNANLGQFTVTRKETDKTQAETCFKACEHGTAIIQKVEKKVVNENPKPLYDLTSLQQEANKIFGYSAQETLDLLQSLYEKRLATYPRTDSRYITHDQKDSVEQLIVNLKNKGLYGSAANFSPYNVDRIINDKKVTDHHGILPTIEVTEEKIKELPVKEQNILTLVMWKLLMAVGPTYTYEATKVVADISGYEFTCNGKKDINAGFKAVEREFKTVLGMKNSIEQPLPEIQQGNSYPVVKLEKEEKMTTPPARYTDATLLADMETCGKKLDDLELKEAMKDKGLGTPATRAGIIEGLIDKGYLQRKSKALIPTEKAFQFIDIVDNTLKQPELTASWEYQLALIQKGELRKGDFMAGVEDFVQKFVNNTKVDDTKVFHKFKVVGKCPKCGADVQYGKFGGFCSQKCGFTISKVYGKEITEKQITDLLAGKKVLIKNLYSAKKDKHYDAYFQAKGVSSYTYTNKEGASVTGYGLDYDMSFPDKKK